MNASRYQPWVNVALFEDIRDGQTFAGVLRDQSFESRVYYDKLLQTFLFLCPPRATFRVQVRQKDFPAAIAFAEQRSDPVVQRAIHCPSCSSLRVNYPQMTRKFFLPTLLLHLGIIFRIIDHEAYCEHCHHTWNLSKRPAPSLTNVPKAVH